MKKITMLTILFFIVNGFVYASDNTAILENNQIKSSVIAKNLTYDCPLEETGIVKEVFLKAVISDKGTVDDIKIIQSCGESQLDEAAVNGVKKWRYSPALGNGKAVISTKFIRVKFHLNDSDEKIIAAMTNDIAKKPNNAVAYYKRGKAYLSEVEYDLALIDLNKAIEINPYYSAAYLSRGFIYGEKKRDDLAIEEYSKAISIDSSYPLAYSYRAYMYNKTGHYDLAIKDCDNAIEINPKYAKAYFIKGTAYENLRLYQKAIDTYRSLFIQISPQDSQSIQEAKNRINILEAM